MQLENEFKNSDRQAKGIVPLVEFRRISSMHLDDIDLKNIEKILSECVTEVGGNPTTHTTVFNYPLFLAVVDVAFSKIDTSETSSLCSEPTKQNQNRKVQRFPTFSDSYVEPPVFGPRTPTPRAESLRSMSVDLRTHTNSNRHPFRHTADMRELRTPATPPSASPVPFNPQLESSAPVFRMDFSPSVVSPPRVPLPPRMKTPPIERDENRWVPNTKRMQAAPEPSSIISAPWSSNFKHQEPSSQFPRLETEIKKPTPALRLIKHSPLVIPMRTDKHPVTALCLSLKLLILRRQQSIFSILKFHDGKQQRDSDVRKEQNLRPLARCLRNIFICRIRECMRNWRLFQLEVFIAESCHWNNRIVDVNTACIKISRITEAIGRSLLRQGMNVLRGVNSKPTINLDIRPPSTAPAPTPTFPGHDSLLESMGIFEEKASEEEMLSHEEAMDMCRQAASLSALVHLFKRKQIEKLHWAFKKLKHSKNKMTSLPVERRRVTSTVPRSRLRWQT